jgi:nucleoside-diphosphate-sugar epimerase
MNNLIIGDTSQLSYFFPKEYERISARDINFSKIKEKYYDKIFLLFAEQRTFLNETEKFFIETNVHYTLKIINELKNHTKKIIIYSTSELWNNYDGEIFIENKYDYNYTPYIKSKEVLCDTINGYSDEYSNVHIIYPFNFNSPYRKNGFLFSKIFDSLINKTINYIGDINFNRDLIHPKIIVNESINADKNKLIGSGELVNIEMFVSDLFSLHNMEYKNYLFYENKNNLTNIRKNYYSGISYSNYENLLKLTKNDIYEYKLS